MDRYDYKTLKDCLSHKNGDWVGSQDTVITVGHILNRNYIFEGANEAFEFIEKPWHWETEMRDICKDYELTKLMRPILQITDIDEIRIVLDWLEAFGYEQGTIDELEESWNEEYAETLCANVS